MLDSRNLLEVLVWEPGECLYTDPSGRRIVLDVADPDAMWGGSDGVYRVEEVTDALVLAADDGVVLAWALPGPLPELGPLIEWEHSAVGPCWLTDVKGLSSCGGTPFPSIDLPLVPVWDSAFFKSAKMYPTGQVLRTVMSLHTQNELSLTARRWSVKSATKPTQLSSHFDDMETGTTSHVQHLGPASWDVQSDPNEPLLLVKLYDRFHGLQRARVLVDDQRVGIWQAMRGDRKARWAFSYFGMPPGLPSTFRLTVDPLPGTPLWDFAVYEVIKLVQRFEPGTLRHPHELR